MGAPARARAGWWGGHGAGGAQARAAAGLFALTRTGRSSRLHMPRPRQRTQRERARTTLFLITQNDRRFGAPSSACEARPPAGAQQRRLNWRRPAKPLSGRGGKPPRRRGRKPTSRRRASAKWESAATRPSSAPPPAPPCTVGLCSRRAHGQNEPHGPPALAPCRQIGQAPTAHPGTADGHAAKASQGQRALDDYMLIRDSRAAGSFLCMWRGWPGFKRRSQAFAPLGFWRFYVWPPWFSRIGRHFGERGEGARPPRCSADERGL
jgi:hypothetical protein